LRVARRRRAERFYACGALERFRAARSTRTLGVMNPKFEEWFWRVFNFLARRVVAVVFMIGGTLGALFTLPLLFPGGMISVNGVPTDDFGMRLIGFLAFLFVAVAGVALFRARPFRSRDMYS